MKHASKNGLSFRIRRATEADADAIAEILQGVTSEKVYTAIERPWPVDEQRRYLKSLSPRETFQVAESDQDGLIGYQSLDLYSHILPSMAHVATLGTFLKREWRRQGVGEALFQANRDFARKNGFHKFVIQVRGSNLGAQAFYKRLGFRECGRLTRQVVVAGHEDDEVLMECFILDL